MKATLYAVPGSHPSRTGELMLEHKGVDYRRVDLVPGMHWALVRLRGFPGRRVPAMMLEGRRVQGTKEFARVLDGAVPEPPLLPSDPKLRAAVEEAERWGEEELQPLARRLLAAALVRDPDLVHERGGAGRMGPVLSPYEPMRRFLARGVARSFGATGDVPRADRDAVPAMLDRVDGFIAEGVLNGTELNAADLQVVTSLALLDYLLELRPQLRDRPLTDLLDRVLPEPG